MLNNGQSASYLQFDLQPGTPVSLWVEGCDVQCLHGRVWITEENGGEDICLEAGQKVHLTHPGQTVVVQRSIRRSTVPAVSDQDARAYGAFRSLDSRLGNRSDRWWRNGAAHTGARCWHDCAVLGVRCSWNQVGRWPGAVAQCGGNFRCRQAYQLLGGLALAASNSLEWVAAKKSSNVCRGFPLPRSEAIRPLVLRWLRAAVVTKSRIQINGRQVCTLLRSWFAIQR